MNKEEVINKINEMTVETFFSKTLFVQQKKVIELIEQLDEPESGHADEAPRYVKNILARLRELPLHDREVWLKAIMSEFEQDFSHAKWREGYEVEKEKRYTVVMKTTKQPLYYNVLDKKLFFSMGGLATKLTRKELEEAGFGWVFDCEGVEVEEVDK